MIAARIAAVTIFANRFAVYAGINYGDVPQEDVAVRDLVGGVENAATNEVQISTVEIEEALSTGLFSSRGSQRFGWAHQTYAEFLAAWYLVQHQLSFHQIKSLIVHPGDMEEKLVPQMHECAAWLAGMLPEVFRMIVERDPQVLLQRDVATAEVDDRAALVTSLLTLYDEEKLLDTDLNIRWRYNKLNHPGISDQLRPYIIDSSKRILVRRAATDIAEACECQSLQEDLLSLTLNQSEPLPLRINAAYAINRIGDCETKARLKPLAYGEAGDDPEDELKGCGLRALWPDHLSGKELFTLLTYPKRQHLIGSYHMFLSGEIVNRLQPADLPSALHWVEDFGGSSDWHVLSELKRGIMVKAWENLEGPGVIQAFARTYLSQLKRHQRSDRIDLSDDDKRHHLLLEMLPLLGEFDLSYIWLVSGTPPIVMSRDVFWLIERLKRSKSKEEQQVFANLIDRTVDFREVDQIDAIVNASQDNPVLANTFAWVLLPVELGSSQAEEMKKHHLEMQRWSADREDHPLVEPPPEERIAYLLDKCEEGDAAAWWRLNLEMTLESNSQYYGDELTSDLTALPGWKNANELTRSRIVDCARKYIVEGQPETEKWLGTNIIHRPAFAGYRAFRLLLHLADQFLFEIEPPVWQKWASIIVCYPTDSEGESRNKQKELICLAYQRAPEEVIQNLLFMIDKENKTGFSSAVNNVTGCFDAKLVDALLTKLQDPALKADTISSLLNVLLNHGVPEAVSLTKSLVEQPVPSDPEGKSKAVVAARLLLGLTEDAGWSVVWPALQQDTEFAEDVLSGLGHVDRGATTFVQKLSEEQLAELHVWMVRRYPHSKDPVLEGGYFVGNIGNMSFLRDSILNALKQRGTPQACGAISRIIQELPELDWLKWHLLEAQQIARRETWIPSSPEDVINLASYSKLVLSLHGIRTRGAWQKELNPEIEDAELKHIPLDYGFFRVIKLLIPYSRRRQVEWFREEYTRIRDRYPEETPSVIAHSFGTYLVASALESYREIRFDRIIFCGSIVPQDYDWSRAIKSGQVNGVLNECAGRDIWVKLASWLIADAGPSGAYGFSDLANGRVRQRRQQLLRHSDYLYRLNYQNNWLPFLKRGEPQELELGASKAVNLKFRISLVVLLIFLIVLAWFIFRRL
jgi:predicted NACHT family NTPase/pimeloyl-ACP methyl ester carboxylesterase